MSANGDRQKVAMKPGRRYPSSTDVARAAGVSQSAVSRAFSEGKSVSEETSRKVFEAAKKLGYSPNFIPRILLKHRSHLVAVAISGTSNPFYALALEEFTKGLQKTGHQVLLVQVDSDHALDGIVPKLASYRVDAIVSALPVSQQGGRACVRQVRIPTISFNTPVKNRWVTSVCSDSAGGAGAVADLLVMRGAKIVRVHRRKRRKPCQQRAFARIQDTAARAWLHARQHHDRRLPL